MKKAQKLNLGCGRDIYDDYVNMDIVPGDGVDVIADLEKVLPFADNSFDEIYADNVLEHVRNLNGLLRELHRICRKGGSIIVIVPHFSFFGSFTDPTHKRFFGYHTFDYYTEKSDYNFYTDLRFEIVSRKLQYFWIKNQKTIVKSYMITWLVNMWPLFYERFLCWVFPLHEIHVVLRPIKNEK